MSVCSRISKIACLNLINFLYILTLAVAWSFTDGNAIRYVIPVSWKSSYFHIMEHIHIASHNSRPTIMECGYDCERVMTHCKHHYITKSSLDHYEKKLVTSLSDIDVKYCNQTSSVTHSDTHRRVNLYDLLLFFTLGTYDPEGV